MRSLIMALGVAPLLFSLGCSTAEEDDPSSEEAALTAETACLPTLACAAPAMAPHTNRLWRHWIKTPTLVTNRGEPVHRGRDLFLNPEDPQLVIAQFAYSLSDIDLDDEDVDVFVQRDCKSGWEKLGTATTTTGGQPHATVEGVSDHGGRIYYPIPKDKRLGPGRHRLRLVVAGDGSSTDLFLDIVPKGTPTFISDVDGTLTSSETIEAVALAAGVVPETHKDAPEVFQALAAKGYRPFYLTARPEQLVNRTRQFLEAHGFPPGIIHTSTSMTGAGSGDSAAEFKKGELAMLAKKGLVPTYGFGNRASDAAAYATISPENHRVFYQIEGDVKGRKIQAYTEMLSTVRETPAVCK
jgi:phosphatidate phosphatase PAH1